MIGCHRCLFTLSALLGVLPHEEFVVVRCVAVVGVLSQELFLVFIKFIPYYDL
jgi:hypothetical protein